ncbi:unnamed protein product [Larinioides sclopetarius]|uniref:Uncharacterized protein n=1 Tax=Larinioides sclopetarius TaxID=280406 RepID=A0AAV1ZAW6_9ARAC
MLAYTAIVLIATLFGYVSARGCPAEHLTRPCKCTIGTFGETLQCENITDRSIFDGVMRRTRGILFKEFKLSNSQIDLIPSEYLQQKRFMRISIKDSELTAFSDETSSASNSVQSLTFVNVTFSSGFPWRQLKIFPNLQDLTVVRVNISSLGQNFKNNISKKLKQVSFDGTNTTDIDESIFSEYSRLEVVGIENIGLKMLKRSYFPSPAKIKIALFNGNEFRTLPEDVIESMPKLRIIELNRNKLTEISRTVFQKVPQELMEVRLEDNPLNCNCNMYGILALTSRTNVVGTCTKPNGLNGKKLKDLVEKDFESCN